MRPNPAHRLFLIFQLENILRSNLNFSTSYGRSTDWMSVLGLLWVTFIWLEQKISLQCILIGGVDVCPPHVQTVSTSFMSKLVKVKLSQKSNEQMKFLVYHGEKCQKNPAVNWQQGLNSRLIISHLTRKSRLCKELPENKVS